MEWVVGLGLFDGFSIAVAIVDVAIVAYVLYRVLLLIKGTTAVPILAGLVFLVLAYVISRRAGLTSLHWLLGHFLNYSLVVGLIVLFQNDIRRGLARLGSGWTLGYDRAGAAERIEEVVSAAMALAERKAGATIVLERTADLAELAATGVRLDAAVSEGLLRSIFQPGSALHDGAVVISRGRIAAARCVLPLSGAEDLDRDLGTRHRSALGLTEEVDAAVLVVSEERGHVSLAVGGHLHRDMEPEALRKFLLRLFAPPRRARLPLPGRKAA